jgi:CheY-like chemotaxis protein
MTDKKRILFVDDEPAVLAGMRAVFRRDRDRWDMVFALGSQAALDELHIPFDVVVSDKRMPGMNGLELFERIRATYPHTGCIMLSGSTGHDELELTHGRVDELLGKPCDARTLRAAIEAALVRAAARVAADVAAAVPTGVL